MKILILGAKEYPFQIGNDKLPSGGIERYVEELSNNLSKKHRITIITRNEYSKNNITTKKVPYIKGRLFRTPTFSLFSLIYGLKENFDVIISNDVFANFFGVLLSKIKKKPVITVFHDTVRCQPQFNKIQRKILAKMEDYATKNAMVPVLLNKKSEKHFKRRMKIIKQGFKKTRIEKEKQNKTIILYIGRLLPVKGVDTLIKSLQYIKQDYECWIVGDGYQRKELERLAKKLKTNTIFFGYRKDVNTFYSKADIFVQPSITEGMPFTLLEAMNAKIPIIASDIGICTEKEAHLFMPGNEKELAGGINRILADTNYPKILIKNAYKYLDSFSWNNVIQEYELMLNNIQKQDKTNKTNQKLNN